MKAKTALFILLALFINLKTNAQQEKKIQLNFILLIDDKVQLSNSSFNIKFTMDGKVNEISNLEYEAGKFYIDTIDYNKLVSDKISDISLNFNYHPQKINENEEYVYQVEINQRILRSKNIVVYIYNLDTRKKRKKYRFTPLSSERKYTYEIDCGDLFIGRIRK